MENKTVVITGASSGIGKATAQYFAQNGWKVAATMRSPEMALELNAIENIKIFALDVTHQESIDRAFNEILQEMGSIDALVNNAGYALNGPFELSTDEQIRKEFDVNVFGLMNTTRTFLKHFREKRNGVIVNISSMGGKVTFPLISTYHATKFAVEGFTESLSYEIHDLGVKVKLIEPGAIATNFYGRSMDFAKSEVITDYNPYCENFYDLSSKSGTVFTQPEVVAAVIFEATTDGTDQLRYVTDEYAKQIIAMKETHGDEAFVSNIKANYAVK